MIKTREQFIEAARVNNAHVDAEMLERKIFEAKKLQKQLANIGIASEVSDKGQLLIAGEYIFSGGYKLSKGERTVSLGYMTIRKGIAAAIGNAMKQLDKPKPESKPKPRYTYHGDTLGEILEEIIREIAYEMAGDQ